MNTHPPVRSTSGASMSAPLTQNTAPILEHRCLYTHDLRRKAKRWQDGLLRFHTFNKRVMVYDFPARNYIGDTHWREECTVQDGDELQLDRPVLVQVCDQIGSVEQDLTELLESRKKKHAAAEEPAQRRAPSAPQHVRHSPSGHLATLPPTPLPQPPPALQPKSLNAVLGRSASRLGKAALPAKSPYDIRGETQLSRMRDGRPLKKARLESPVLPRQREDTQDDTILEHQATYQDLSHRHAHLGSSELAPGHSGQLRGRSQVLTSRTPISTSSAVAGVCASPCTSRVNTAGSSESSARHKTRQRQDAKPKDRLDIDTSHNDDTLSWRCTSPRSTPHSRERSCGSPQRCSSPPPALAERQKASTGQSCKPRSKLKVASHKPRRKLMYRDLLPPDQPRTSYESSKTVRRSPTAARTRAQDPTNNYVGDMALPPMEKSQMEEYLPRSKSSLLCEDMANLEPQIVARRVRGITPIHDQSANHQRSTRKSVIDQNISEGSTVKHDTNASLQKADGILASQNFGNKASKQTRRQALRHLRKDRDPSPSISITDSISLADTTASSEYQGDNVTSPILISSPEVEAGAVTLSGRAHEEAAGADTDGRAILKSPSLQRNKCADLEDSDEAPAHMDESLTNASPVRPRRQAAATSLGGPPQLRSATSLPNFVPVRPTGRMRSPLKASMSENSMDAVDARRGQGAQPPQPAQPGPCRALVAEPWSREAWDLFGCTRDGVELSYGDFCRKEMML